MILSRNEVAAVLFKAARGQGVSLGHGEMFTAAAVRALGSGCDPSVVSKALGGRHSVADFKDNVISNARVTMAGPIAVDALLCGAEQVRLHGLDAPQILEAMIANAHDVSGLEAVLHFEGDDAVVRLDQSESTPKTNGPIEIPDADWTRWQSWAAQTYVPATEASRLAGAGAGLTDND